MLLGAGVAVRIFVIYHDAIHRSFFESRRWNERLATVLQVWTLTPVKLWRANHLAHHGRFGDLGTRDIADTIVFTKQQLDAMPPWKRRFWRVVRTPFVFFTLLPLVQWLGEYPLLAGNIWLWSGLALHGALAWEVSAWHAGSVYLAMMTGLILFHLQHGISPGYRSPTESWSSERAALLGSTWVRIPRPLTWFTLGIEFHHVHHLHPGVPCYAIARCHREAPPRAWDEVTVGTWRVCLSALANVMWDTERGKLVPFSK
jgi:omega-6 fatty acid desaturase (delta-12 desaturase)